MLTLYASPASPYARCARVCLIESGLEREAGVRMVSTTPMDSDPGLVAVNPVGKIPALARDEGPTLFDSRVICRYLDFRGNRGLYPETRLWEVLALEAMAHGIMDAAVAMVYEAKFHPAEKVHQPWIEAQWAKIARTLDVIEGRWTSHLSGKATMGQLSLAVALGYLDLRHAARSWREGRPQLVSWEAAFGARASLSSTRPA